MLEKFIKYAQAKNENCSDIYLTQVFNNCQDSIIVQFLKDELKHKIKELKEQYLEVEKLQLKLGEDSRILHNVIDMETNKSQKLQKRINHVMSLYGCQQVVSSNDIIEALSGDLDHFLEGDSVG